MDENTKKLKLMRFWLFGTFVIFAATIIVTVGWLVGGAQALTLSLPSVAFVAVVCVAAYFGYRWFINRK